MCHAPHHNPFPAEEVNAPRFAALRKTALLDDPVAMDAMYHIFLPFVAGYEAAAEGPLRDLMLKQITDVSSALGWITGAAEAVGNKAGRRELYDALFPTGPGTYELTITGDSDGVTPPTPPGPRPRLDA